MKKDKHWKQRFEGTWNGKRKNSSSNTRKSAMVDYVLWRPFLFPAIQLFSPKALVSLCCRYLFTWPVNIGFWLLWDKNQILFTSPSPVPSTVFRKQWMFYEGLLMGRRRESVFERRIEKAYWERKLESSTLTKRNTMSLCATEKVIYAAVMSCFPSSLLERYRELLAKLGLWGDRVGNGMRFIVDGEF